MRAFVAIPIDEPLRRRIGEIRRRLERIDADVRWVALENLHLTLKFLGELDEPTVVSLRERLRSEAHRSRPFEIRLSGVGRFPPSGVSRVIWIGCRGEVSCMEDLARGVEQAALEIGVPKEGRDFSPHLTIGRVKSPRNSKPLAAAVHGEEEVGSQRVESFTMYRSTLTPTGPIYDPVELFRLGP